MWIIYSRLLEGQSELFFCGILAGVEDLKSHVSNLLRLCNNNLFFS